MDYLCEYGLVGAGLFVAFVGCVLWLGLRQIARTRAVDRCFLHLAAVTGLVAMLTTSLVSPATQWTVDAVTLWCLLGLSMAIIRLEYASAPFIQDPDHTVARDLPSKQRWRVPGPLLAQGALAAVAIVFLLRGTPQGLLYYRAAVENSTGLKSMEKADALAGEQQTKCL